MSNNLTQKDIENISNQVLEMLINQSSLTIDFIKHEEYSLWERANNENIWKSMDNLKQYLKNMEIGKE